MKRYVVKFYKEVMGDNGQRAEVAKESAKSTRRVLLLLSSRASVHFVIKHEFHIGRSMRTVSAWPRLNFRRRRAGVFISSKISGARCSFEFDLRSLHLPTVLRNNLVVSELEPVLN